MDSKNQTPTTPNLPTEHTEWDNLATPDKQPSLKPESIASAIAREILSSEQKLQALDRADELFNSQTTPEATETPESSDASAELEALNQSERQIIEKQNELNKFFTQESVEQLDSETAQINEKLDQLNILDQLETEASGVNEKLGVLDAINPEIAAQIENEAANISKKLGALDELESPLAAINANFTYDKKELARDYAERELNAEVAETKGVKGVISRIWKGNLFKKYYQKKYENEIYSDEREIDKDGEKTTLGDIIESRSHSAMQRFCLGATEEYSKLIHTEAGESLTEADARTTEIVKSAIEEYATAEIPEGGSLDDLRIEFGNHIARLKAEGRDNKEPLNENMINNYFEVAVQARQRAEHGVAIEKVMEGFKVYNADVRGNIRTEAHRDNLDKITNFLESSKIGQIVPPEALAIAVGTAYSLTQTGARALAGAGAGIGVSAAFAGLRERNRVTEDRARMLRDIASGGKYESADKKQSKYEARIGGTLYDLHPASELTKALEESMKSDNLDFRRNTIAEARVRIGLSDSEHKDLISYSSEDKIGDERLALDIALIKAENSLPDNDMGIKLMKNVIKDNITEDIEQKDQDFKVDRAKLSLKASAKTAALGSAFFFGSQELIAAIDPNKISLFEKAGLLKTKNSEDASETILASLSDSKNYTETITKVSGSDKAAIERYKKAGFKQTETKAAWSETKTDLVEVSPSKSDHKLKTIYDGWANNGTRAADGNELNAYLENGHFRSNASGLSSVNGQTLNINDLVADGKVKGYLTIGGAKFEIQGKMGANGLTWGENGVFTTTTGETIKAIGDNGEKLYKYFEVAVDNGADASGYTHLVPLATDVGSDTFSGKLQEVTETIVNHPATYTFTKTISRDVYTGGAVLPGASSRTGLGGVSMV